MKTANAVICSLRGRWSNVNGHREFGTSLTTCDPKIVEKYEKYQNVDNDDIQWLCLTYYGNKITFINKKLIKM